MQEPVFLGIEGGGTKTIALFATRDLNILSRAEVGPGNFRLLTASALTQLFAQIAALGPVPTAIGIGLAGVREPKDAQQVEAAAREIWGNLPMAITHDLQVALAATATPTSARARVLVLSGTGSCCYGESQSGKCAKVGGGGHVLGDLGSGYDIALRGAKSVVSTFDRAGRWGNLGRNFLRAALLNEPNELISWAHVSDKAAIARLAPVVFQSATEGDSLARRILSDVALQLANDATLCALRLVAKRAPVAFVFAGSVLQKQPAFARRIRKIIQGTFSEATFHIAKSEGALGAVQLAVEKSGRRGLPEPRSSSRPKQRPIPSAASPYMPVFDPAQSPTEARNPKSTNLDRLSIPQAVKLMLHAESEVIPALQSRSREIQKAIALAAHSLKSGGRLFYVGAGTSGRLGVLDASECPPTFRSSPEMVQGIMAGGQTALWQAVEGAEDDSAAGAAALRFAGVSSKDTVVGIAASGRTPFVWGALEAARVSGSQTILLAFNPALRIDRRHRPDVVILPEVGPEILTGSTRLKCGTATKIILNMISTIAMVRLGKVVSNLMVDLNASNVKLRDRALRIVRELTNCSEAQARLALEENGWAIQAAVRALTRGRDHAKSALR